MTEYIANMLTKNMYMDCLLYTSYFEKKGRQAVIHTISENFKANMTTEEIWKQLDDKVFAHIHVSYIINLGHIRAIEGDEVVMDNEERLLIARSHKQNLKEKHMRCV